MATLEALQALERSRLVQAVPGAPAPEFAFRHSLIQEVAYRSLLRQQRRSLHRAVGEVLEDDFKGRLEDIARELAGHFDAADDPQRAFRYHLLAADQDMRLHSHSEAIAHLDRALETGREAAGSPGAFLDVYLKKGRAQELSGQHPSALDTYQEMEEKAKALEDHGNVLRARLQRAILYSTGTAVADTEKGINIAREILDAARRQADHEAEARAFWILLFAFQFGLEHLDEAVEAGERARELASGLEAPLLQGMIGNDLGSAYLFMGQLEKANSILKEARTRMEQLDNIPMLTNVLANQMLQRALGGEFQDALSFSHEGYQLSERIGNLWGQACSLLYIDIVYAELGDYKRALEAGAQCLRLGNAAGFMGPSFIANATQAWIRENLGLYRVGLDHLSGTPTDLGGPLGAIVGQLVAIRVMLHLRLGELSSAEGLLDQATAHTRKAPSLLHPSVLFTNLARACLALAKNKPDEVMDIVPATIEAQASQGHRLLAHDFYHVGGRALMQMSDHQAALRLIENGLVLASETKSKRGLWRLQALSAEAHDAMGQWDHAESARQKAKGGVHTIAENLSVIGLEESFLEQPEIRSLMIA